MTVARVCIFTSVARGECRVQTTRVCASVECEKQKRKQRGQKLLAQTLAYALYGYCINKSVGKKTANNRQAGDGAHNRLVGMGNYHSRCRNNWIFHSVAPAVSVLGCPLLAWCFLFSLYLLFAPSHLSRSGGPIPRKSTNRLLFARPQKSERQESLMNLSGFRVSERPFSIRCSEVLLGIVWIFSTAEAMAMAAVTVDGLDDPQ